MRNYLAPNITVRGCVTSTTLGQLHCYSFEPHQPGMPATKIDSLGDPPPPLNVHTKGDGD